MKYSLLAFASLLFISSCSWYRDLERSLVKDDEERLKRSKRVVPREQYDQLLVKYEELAKKYEHSKEGTGPVESGLADELQKTSKTSDFDTETVDVFASSQASPAAISVPSDIESQLALYRRGLALKASNPGEATKVFQQLETHAIDPVKARARLQIGLMLVDREQFDLALQVFEDIIQRNANSGVVLNALEGAVTASQKLGLSAKREQYSSMLNDVFGP